MAVRILIADVMAGLATLEPDSVDCVVTSPPYWGLRDYGVEGQLGMEPTLSEHLDAMVRVFEAVKRVLKPTGTLWLNYGDCYNSIDKWGGGGGNTGKQTVSEGGSVPSWAVRKRRFNSLGLKPKDLCMVPNRLAIALQEAGWWIRSEIIWAKPNPMPESVTDRPATSHEKIWLLSKSPRYTYHAEPVKQPCSPNTHARVSQNLAEQEGSHRANGGKKSNGPMRAVVAESTRKLAAENQSMIGSKASREAALSLMVDKRNLRNYEPAPVEVWNIATKPFKDAHFATFPPELAERCIRAGTKQGDLVLDPFAGAGTTGLVAEAMGRDAVLIELSADYAEMAAKRIRAAASSLFGEVQVIGEPTVAGKFDQAEGTDA